MVFYNTNEFRSGLKIIQDSEPYVIIHHEFVKPGKGQAFHRVRLRNLISGRIIEKIFKSVNSVAAADIKDITLTYLYNDGFFWHFINTDNFEQLAATAKIVGDKAKWLKEQTECIITLWNREPIIITPPNFVALKIIAYNPDIKGDTVKNTNYKIAVLNTGAVVKVPTFLQIGELVKIDTRSGEYVSRLRE